MSTTPARKEDVVARRIAGESILVPIRDRLADMQRIFALNDVAEFLWTRLDGETSVDQLAATVSAEFEVDETDARDDIRAFLAELAAEGLVREGTTAGDD